GNRHFAPEGRLLQLVETASQGRVEPVMVDLATGDEIIPGKYALVPGPAASALMKDRNEYLLRKRVCDFGQ
ncbi:transcriptional regulator, partial [Klebsiella pneumoniae]|nr:transcriptional regulator [Klebsiella pneumoniae]